MPSIPKVSFVVPCYNYGRFLPDCLRSIFGQEGGYDFEVIAVDDASTDNTLEILDRFKDPRLHVLKHERNQGHVKTVNEGLAAARGEFVARIDPDDRYRPDFLRTLLPKFDSPEVGFVYGDAAIMDAAGVITALSCDKVHNGADFKGNELPGLLRANFICAPTAIARRNAWHEAMPIPAHLAFNDWYFNLMIARRHDFYYVNHVVADYRVHAANHHSRIIADKSEEPSIRHVLDYIFSQPESTPALEARKRSFRGRAYAAQYLTLATKYFGVGLLADARRCFLAAIRYSPAEALTPKTVQLLAATFLRPEVYTAVKRILAPARQPAAR
jgi:glycosyltransferase involved in cell wall biosynthesis